MTYEELSDIKRGPSIMPAQIETAIPLGRRIGEIMEEKGDAFSYRAFGERIGISKDILSRCINGERYIKPSELEKISHGLNVTVERLKQEDSQEELLELHRLLETQLNLKRAVVLAKKWVGLAVGMTEKCQALLSLGKAYHDSREYDLAHQSWLDAYQLAQRINDRYREKDYLYRIIKNLMVSFAVRKEYIKMSEVLIEAEEQFGHMPEFMGAICYSRAQLAEQLGDIIEAKAVTYKSLDFFIKSGHQPNIGRAKVNIAHYEYRTQSYGKAKRFLEEALVHFGEDNHSKLFALKDYAKVLIKIGDITNALNIIEQAMMLCELNDYPQLNAKFHLLLSLAENNPIHSKKVLEMENVSDQIRYLSTIQLMNYYKQIGDASSLLRYYEIAETFGGTQTDILAMEGF